MLLVYPVYIVGISEYLDFCANILYNCTYLLVYGIDGPDNCLPCHRQLIFSNKVLCELISRVKIWSNPQKIATKGFSTDSSRF